MLNPGDEAVVCRGTRGSARTRVSQIFARTRPSEGRRLRACEARAVAREIAATFGAAQGASFDGKGYCWVELGGGRAAFAEGDFYASPAPAIRLRAPAAHWHWGKVLFERSWIGGVERALARVGLGAGATMFGVASAR